MEREHFRAASQPSLVVLQRVSQRGHLGLNRAQGQRGSRLHIGVVCNHQYAPTLVIRMLRECPVCLGYYTRPGGQKTDVGRELAPRNHEEGDSHDVIGVSVDVCTSKTCIQCLRAVAVVKEMIGRIQIPLGPRYPRILRSPDRSGMIREGLGEVREHSTTIGIPE